MARYLDPKNDLAFKRIFGEHDYLCISLLNSLLPLDESERIVSIEYLPSEHVPRTPLGKDSIVDVKCRDVAGRFFIVEMQLSWSSMFMKRIVFNAAQALVKQGDKDDPDGEPKMFSDLQPVYTLAIVNRYFPNKDENRWMYTYKVADIENPRYVFEGLNFVVIDLETKDLVRKIRAQQGWTMEKKRMAVLWLRFLKETGYSERIDSELVEDDTIRMAVEICKEGGYTQAELNAYDDYLNQIRTELEVAKYAEVYKKQQKEIEEQQKEIEEQQKAFEEQQKEIEDKKKALEEQQKEIEDKQKELEEQKKALEDKDKALEDKDKALEKQGKALEDKDKALEKQGKAFEEQKKELEDKDKALEDKDKALEEQGKVIEDKDRALEDKDKLIEELKKQLTARFL
jgi:predicted transposase/invertase (TIGR01784 family)